jgi:hypothetical protein
MASSDTSNTEFAYLGQVLGWDTMEKWLETKKEDESIGQLASIASLFGTEETKLWIRERFSGNVVRLVLRAYIHVPFQESMLLPFRVLFVCLV